MSYATAPTLCPAATVVLFVIFLPALWPLLLAGLVISLVLVILAAIP